VQLHLLDGTFELFRMFYGAPPGESASGQEVGAARALLRSFAALLRQPDVTHVGVAFDHVIESFRNALFDGYKTGEGMDPVLHAQFPLAERAARALGLVVWPMEEFEADDALASAAAKYADAPGVERVLLCSPDKDLAQSVRGEKVVAFDRLRKKLMDEEGVVAKFGIPPRAIPAYLALVGDPQDGIPGIPRWGAKSTATVLARYGRIDAIPADAADWDVKVRGAKTLAANLEAEREAARLYERLATLRLDAPIPEPLDALRWTGPSEDLAPLCAELRIDPPRLPSP